MNKFKTNQEVTDIIEKVLILFAKDLPDLIFNLSVETSLDVFLKRNSLPGYSHEWVAENHQYDQIFTLYKHEKLGVKVAAFNFTQLANLLPEFDYVIAYRCREGNLYGARIENETIYTKDNNIIFYETPEQFEILKKEVVKVNY